MGDTIPLPHAVARSPIVLAVVVGLGMSLLTTAMALGGTFTVNSTVDAVDARPGDGKCRTASGVCTLRAAIMEANATTASSTINLPAAIYVLTITGADENDARTGDLDIKRNMTIVASGGVAVIRGQTGWNDRIFDIHGVTVEMRSVEIVNGNTGGSGEAFSGLGGGIAVRFFAALSLVNSVVRGNFAEFSGGGIYVSDEAILILQSSTVLDNRAGMPISPQEVRGAGGGIFVEEGSRLVMRRSSIVGNTSQDSGGGLFNSGQAILSDCTIAGNTSVSSDSGGIRTEGPMSIERCTVSGNRAQEFGGGIGNENFGQLLTITNSTISGNTVVDGGGGGLDVFEASATLNNVTITANTASTAGGGIAFDGFNSTSFTLLIRNSIVGKNSAPSAPDCHAGTGTFGLSFSLLEVGQDCVLLAPTSDNIIGPDPHLAPLSANGGPTATHALCTGVGVPDASCTGRSPAIDVASTATPGSGGTACAAIDQRGVSRPQGSRCDMGAFEASAVGEFDVEPADATVEAGDVLLYAFRWTETGRWRDLQTLEFRIVDGAEPILWLRWDQESNTFSVFDEKRGRFGPGFLPGSHHHLKGEEATLELDQTSVLTSGPEGRDVTLTLAVTFRPKAAGHDHRDYVVEVLATDDFGNTQGFDQAGTLEVVRR
jgi:CSLREA domain-containing protein